MRLKPEEFEFPRGHVQVANLWQKLGEAARFILNDDAMSLVVTSMEPPELPRVVGGCWPIFAVRDERWLQFTFPAFVLPLQWLAGGPDDSRLPPDLLKVADKVRKELGIQPNTFGLAFHQADQPWPDLSLLDRTRLEADSSFAALAIGLISASNNVPTNPDIWVSAVWDSGFTNVDLLPKKLEAAARFGAKKFFVASSQIDEARQLGLPLEIRNLGKSINSKLSEALSPCLAECYLEPSADQWEDCRHYHALLRDADIAKASEFYSRVLIDHIAQRCRSTLRVSASARNIPKIESLITIATRNPEPILLMVKTLQVSHVLILHTKGDDGLAEDAKRAQQQIEKNHPGCHVELKSFVYNTNSSLFPRDFKDSLIEAIETWSGYQTDARTVFDIDRGLTMHKLALLESVLQPDHLLVNLSVKILPGNKFDHGTEQMFLWQMRDGFQGPFVQVSRTT